MSAPPLAFHWPRPFSKFHTWFSGGPGCVTDSHTPRMDRSGVVVRTMVDVLAPESSQVCRTWLFTVWSNTCSGML